ncbi:hypothetical protein HZ996_04900 [Cryomorphaceae bacterium]|nr:hypothetical protein HZ996_04900 [Cryomorphaceae bacterium]
MSLYRRSLYPVAVFFISILPYSLVAQYPTVPLNADLVYSAQAEGGVEHSSFLPLIDEGKCRIEPQAQSQRNWLYRKLFEEHLVDQNTEDYHITIDPVVDFRSGFSNNSRFPFTDTYGFSAEGRIGKNVWFQTGLYFGFERFPDYVDARVRLLNAVPGRVVPQNDPNGALSWYWGRGTIMWRLNKFFTLRGGTDKHFIGDGYRSLIWSDNAMNSPFFEIRTNVGQFQYVNLWTVQRDINWTPPSQNSYFRKYVSAHYLSWNFAPKWEWSLFETIVWAGDSSGVGRMEPEMLNPIIFLRAAEYAVNSGGGNAMLGTNLRYSLNDHFTFYGQFSLDELKFSEILSGDGWWANKFAWQLGVKGYNLGIEGLHAQLEYNQIRPYMYSHRSTFTSFTHYNYSNAHPAGGNLREGVAIFRYNKDRWRFKAQFNYLVQGRDTLGSNWGANPLISYDEREQEYGNEIGQGVRTEVFFTDLQAAWVVNPATNLQIETGVMIRNANSEVTDESFTYWYFGLRTLFANYYYDY